MPYFISSFSSASYATTASYALNAEGGGGSAVSSSWASSSISSSYALTASYALNGGSGGITTGSGVGAMREIATLTTSASQTTVTFDNIPNTYRDLRIVAFARGTTAATAVLLYTRINGDSGSNYDWVRESRLGQASGFGTNYAASNAISAQSSDAGVYTHVDITIPGYTTIGTQKTFTTQNPLKFSPTLGNVFNEMGESWWRNTSSAVNKIELYPSAGEFVSESTFTLYGIGGPAAALATSASYALTASYVPSAVLEARSPVSASIASLTNNQTYTGSISTFGKSFIITSVTVNTDTRIRLYGSQSYVIADLSRPIGTDPASNAGLITELILSGSPTLYNYTMSPVVAGANMDVAISPTIYYTVTNLSGTTANISMSFNRMLLE